MTTASPPPMFSLNLSEKYVPKWGLWEIAREIICNAIDADPTWSQETPSGDTLKVITYTSPSIEELLVIGETSKTAGGNTIGQFGEGFKLATLTCLRLKGTLSVRCPFGTVHFSLIKPTGFTSRILHAQIHEGFEPFPGCEVTIRLEGIASATANKFTRAPYGPIDKPADSKTTTVYNKGVWLQTIKEPSLWDWNFKNLPINRDRSMVDSYNLKAYIAQHLLPKLTIDQAEILQKHPTSFEGKAVQDFTHYATQETRINFATAFKKLHGDKACVASDTGSDNERASGKGYLPIPVPEGYQDLLRKEDVKRAEDMKPKPRKTPRQSLPLDNHAGAVREVTALLELIGCPAEICIFEPSEEDLENSTIAEAEIRKGKMIMHLTKDLFKAGNREKRLGAVCHELAHFHGGMKDDGTLAFEADLMTINVKLACAWLDRTPARASHPETPAE